MLRIGVILALFFIVACGAKQERINSVTSPVTRLRRACDAGEGKACFQLGKRVQEHDQVSNRRAKRFFEEGCSAKYAQACIALGQILEKERSNGISRTGAKSEDGIRYYRRACKLGERQGCLYAFESTFFNASTRQQQIAAMGGLRKLCRQKHLPSCRGLVRGELALGLRPAADTVSTLKGLCQSKENASPFCRRFLQFNCLSKQEEKECSLPKANPTMLDEPSCAKADLPWLLGAIHTGVRGCNDRNMGRLDLKFSEDGQAALWETNVELKECLRSRLAKMAIMPTLETRGCLLKVRF